MAKDEADRVDGAKDGVFVVLFPPLVLERALVGSRGESKERPDVEEGGGGSKCNNEKPGE